MVIYTRSRRFQQPYRINENKIAPCLLGLADLFGHRLTGVKWTRDRLFIIISVNYIHYQRAPPGNPVATRKVHYGYFGRPLSLHMLNCLGLELRAKFSFWLDQVRNKEKDNTEKVNMFCALKRFMKK